MLESFVVFYLGVLMFSQSSGEHFCAGIVVGSVAREFLCLNQLVLAFMCLNQLVLAFLCLKLPLTE